MEFTRIGVLGGTFNPIHRAHIAMAKSAREMLELDCVLLIPASEPPHKQVDGYVSGKCRYEMACRAIEGADGLAVSEIELKRPGKSYTLHTLKALRKQYPRARQYVLVGSDMLLDLVNWYRADALLREAVFACVRRKERQGGEEAAAERLRQEYGAEVIITDIDVPEISSTEIRARVYGAKPVCALVGAQVERYIHENALYYPEDIRRVQMRVKGMLREGRFAHTVGVVMEAAALAERFGADFEKARLAALLHDCGRSVESGALAHAERSAQMAGALFGIEDEEVLAAIRLHTTLGPGATTLTKVVYLADAIEPGRKYEGVEKIRRLAYEDLDAAVCAALDTTIRHVRQNGETLAAASVQALREINGYHPGGAML